jgi:LysR family cys regulon transcriptional activator
MNFQYLRIIREVARHNFNLSRTDQALKTLQSGLSKHIKYLEDK